MSEGTKFETVFAEELAEVRRRRGTGEDAKPPERPKDACCAEHIPPAPEPLDERRAEALRMGLVGLAFSGGGIRSGTVALGFLQGLAQMKLLRMFDYVSSVSGGGYAASWFAAWVKRDGSLKNVEAHLAPSRLTQAASERKTWNDKGNSTDVQSGRVFDEEPGPVHHVRSYANYLTPFPGVGSLDSWTLLAIYLRNTLVNLLILLPMVAAIVFGSRLVVWLYAQGRDPFGVGEDLGGRGLAVLTLLMPLLGLGFMLWNRAQLYAAVTPGSPRNARNWSARRVALPVVVPIGLGCVLGPWLFARDREGLKYFFDEKFVEELQSSLDFERNPWGCALVLEGLMFVVGLLAMRFYAASTGRPSPRRVMTSAVTLGVVFGFLCYAVIQFVVSPLRPDAALLATLGPPSFMLAFVLTGYLEQAIFGKSLHEYEREWRSRLAATMLATAVVWLIFFGATLYLPYAVAWKVQGIRAAVIAGWGVTVLGAIFASRSSRSDPARPESSLAVVGLARIGPPLFLLGILALVSLGVSWVGEISPDVKKCAVKLAVGPTDWQRLLEGAGVCISLSLILSHFADVNIFSLHGVYGNRLVRCFLAASRPKSQRPRQAGGPTNVGRPVRRPNLFTGFDPEDDLPLSELAKLYSGPYPIFNTTLNLNGGRELALRDLRADSFILTPHYCGSDSTGYAKTFGAKDLSLGRAMTISGAAIDPNANLVGSASLTALLTVFNARLGWWLRNPGKPERGGWKATSPTNGLLGRLKCELIGGMTADDDYVHLSDGGHFDNSGVYELIRRRCRYVVQLDAASDPSHASENLANLIQLVRTRLGIRIEIDTSPLARGEDGLSRWHVAIGVIRYDDVDDDALTGTLVFVRSSLTGDEPADLKQYAATNPEFPHHGTFPDQFFEEKQFECYRALGEHLATSVLGEEAEEFDADKLGGTDHSIRVRRFFAQLRGRWFPPPPGHAGRYAESGKMCADLMHSLRTDPAMARLTHDIFPEVQALAPPGPGPGQPLGDDRAEILAVDQMTEVMELAWMGLELDGYYAHPMNQGWMGAFRRWTAAPTFQRYWPVLRGEYSKGFVRFCEKTLNLPPVRVAPERYNKDDSRDTDAVKLLDAEFSREWSGVLMQLPESSAGKGSCGEVAVPEGLHSVVESAATTWLLRVAQPPAKVGGKTPDDGRALEKLKGFPVGLVAAYKTKQGCYEAVLWIRGPYRSLGLGRDALEALVGVGKQRVELHKAIALELFEREKKPLRVIARYPVVGQSPADRLQRTLWRNFFHDYDFTRVRSSDDRGPFVVLERIIDQALVDRLRTSES